MHLLLKYYWCDSSKHEKKWTCRCILYIWNNRSTNTCLWGCSDFRCRQCIWFFFLSSNRNILVHNAHTKSVEITKLAFGNYSKCWCMNAIYMLIQNSQKIWSVTAYLTFEIMKSTKNMPLRVLLLDCYIRNISVSILVNNVDTTFYLMGTLGLTLDDAMEVAWLVEWNPKETKWSI